MQITKSTRLRAIWLKAACLGPSVALRCDDRAHSDLREHVVIRKRCAQASKKLCLILRKYVALPAGEISCSPAPTRNGDGGEHLHHKQREREESVHVHFRILTSWNEAFADSKNFDWERRGRPFPYAPCAR